LNRSKVKVKVTGLPSFRKLRFSKFISSASLPRSSKLMVDYGGMGPNLQLVGAWFLNCLLSKLSHDFKFPTSRNVDIIWLSKGHIFLLLIAAVTRSSVPVVLVCTLNCWCDRGQIQGQGHAAMIVSPLQGLFLFSCFVNNYVKSHFGTTHCSRPITIRRPIVWSVL